MGQGGRSEEVGVGRVARKAAAAVVGWFDMMDVNAVILPVQLIDDLTIRIK